MTIFVVEDERHAEQVGKFGTRTEAVAEIMRREQLGWADLENKAPCTSWRTCGRRYEIVDYDESQHPWRELHREFVVELRESGPIWHARA